AMGPHLLLLLLPGLAGQGSADSLPEKLQAPVGGSILVQCHYRPQDIKARKMGCERHGFSNTRRHQFYRNWLFSTRWPSSITVPFGLNSGAWG
uniref:Triggering receptor expressed on myeloid cells like 1 n=1 Tax=Equus asinus asinus TaxID=83772 RepID=A0A8C4L3Y0_EQUAS